MLAGTPGPASTTSRPHAPLAASDLMQLIETGLPAWHRDALCKEHPELDFFPARGEPTTAQKALCARCAVRSDCLAEALSNPDARFGIWGGTSERERRAIRSERASRRAIPAGSK